MTDDILQLVRQTYTDGWTYYKHDYILQLVRQTYMDGWTDNKHDYILPLVRQTYNDGWTYYKHDYILLLSLYVSQKKMCEAYMKQTWASMEKSKSRGDMGCFSGCSGLDKSIKLSVGCADFTLAGDPPRPGDTAAGDTLTRPSIFLGTKPFFAKTEVSFIKIKIIHMLFMHLNSKSFLHKNWASSLQQF